MVFFISFCIWCVHPIWLCVQFGGYWGEPLSSDPRKEDAHHHEATQPQHHALPRWPISPLPPLLIPIQGPLPYLKWLVSSRVRANPLRRLPPVASILLPPRHYAVSHYSLSLSLFSSLLIASTCHIEFCADLRAIGFWVVPLRLRGSCFSLDGVIADASAGLNGFVRKKITKKRRDIVEISEMFSHFQSSPFTMFSHFQYSAQCSGLANDSIYAQKGSSFLALSWPNHWSSNKCWNRKKSFSHFLLLNHVLKYVFNSSGRSIMCYWCHSSTNKILTCHFFSVNEIHMQQLCSIACNSDFLF